MSDPARDFTTCGGHGGQGEDGRPCGRPAGWGTDGDGRCRDHRQARAGRVAGRIEGEDLPDPPDHLSDAAADRWMALVRLWVFSPSELLLLEEGLGAWDRVREARTTLRREGYTLTNPDSGHTSRHPASRELDQSLTQLRQCLKQLDLEAPE